jgi:hypothetical protein
LSRSGHEGRRRRSIAHTVDIFAIHGWKLRRVDPSMVAERPGNFLDEVCPLAESQRMPVAELLRM